MLKIILTSVMYLCAVYCIGESIRRNSKIDEFLAALEGGYTRINTQLENSSVRSGLAMMRKAYGWICISMFAIYAALMYFSPGSKGAMSIVSQLFVLTFMFWISIKWAVDHKATLAEYWGTFSLMLLGPVLMGICDTLLSSNFIHMLAMPLTQLPVSRYFDVSIFPPLLVGFVCSLMLLMCFVVYYLMVWVITTPIFFVSVVAVVVPINIARLLGKIDREKPFLWFVIFVGGVCTLWLTQL